MEAAPAADEAPNWAELPLDVILAVLGRLDHITILMAADQVCRSWRRAARDEPTLWRRIVMRGDAELSFKLNRQGMACDAVRLSAGQCEAFCGEYAGDDGFLLYLSEQAPCLKSLRLISCDGVSGECISDLIENFHLLEELEISLCGNIHHGQVYEIISEACPQLKRFRLSKRYSRWSTRWNQQNESVPGVSSMHELRSLVLFGNRLSNEGLGTILENCPYLVSLDIRHCFQVVLDEDDALRAKCARIKTLRLPYDSTDDYDLLPVETPVYYGKTEGVQHRHSPPSSYTTDYSDSDEWGDYDGDGYYSRYEDDLDKYDWMLPRSMRTFLN